MCLCVVGLFAFSLLLSVAFHNIISKLVEINVYVLVCSFFYDSLRPAKYWHFYTCPFCHNMFSTFSSVFHSTTHTIQKDEAKKKKTRQTLYFENISINVILLGGGMVVGGG